MAADWAKIKNEYITTGISQRKLAEKYKINASVLMSKANREQWSKKSKQVKSRIQAKTEEKVIEKLAEQKADYIVNVAMLNYKLSGVIESFIDKDMLIEAKDVKALSSALKDIKDIQMATSNPDDINRPIINIDLGGFNGKS